MMLFLNCILVWLLRLPSSLNIYHPEKKSNDAKFWTKWLRIRQQNSCRLQRKIHYHLLEHTAQTLVIRPVIPYLQTKYPFHQGHLVSHDPQSMVHIAPIPIPFSFNRWPLSDMLPRRVAFLGVIFDLQERTHIDIYPIVTASPQGRKWWVFLT